MSMPQRLAWLAVGRLAVPCSLAGWRIGVTGAVYVAFGALLIDASRRLSHAADRLAS